MEHPLVLVTNDDGIDSAGLIALACALQARGLRVLVVAPATNMSGAGAAMGPVGPAVAIDRVVVPGIEAPCFAVHAPPGMIVIAGVNGAFGEIPGAVASGVNAGVNLGKAILHSGTVGAAMTGQNLGLPSVAVSLQAGESWGEAAEVGADVLLDLIGRDRPMLANVNAPAGITPGTPVERTRLSKFGSVTSAIVGDELQFQLIIDADALDEEGTDGAALKAGRTSVTFLSGIGGHDDADVDVTLRTIGA